MRSAVNILIIIVSLVTSAQSQDLNDYIREGKALTDRSKYAEAINIYSEALKSHSDYRLYTGRALAFLESGDVSAAVEDYKLANGQSYGSGFFGLTICSILRGDYEQAFFYLRKHLDSEYRLPRKRILLDKYISKLENKTGWKDLWKNDWYTQLEKATADVEYYVSSGRGKEASGALAVVKNMYAESAEVSYLQGLVESSENNTKEAVEHLRSAIEKDSKYYPAWDLFISELEKSGHYYAAANASKEAMEIFPERTELILKTSACLLKANDREGAGKYAEIYLGLYPGAEDANRQAGLVASQRGEYSKALRYFSGNIENYPGKAECFTDRAGVYLRLKSWDAAIYDYSMALDLSPRDADAYYNKGLALMEKGNNNKACYDFKMALRYGNRKAAKMISKYCIK